MKRIYLLLSLLTGCLYMQAAIYNVRDFGAKADGKTIDSPAINRAIEAAAQEGGGTVYLPAGEYACYSIRLKSNIHLYLEQGARIIAAFPGKDEGYDSAEPNEHNKYQDFHQRSGTDLRQRTDPRRKPPAGCRQQSDQPQGLPERHAERLLHAPLRTLRPACHRCRAPHPA